MKKLITFFACLFLILSIPVKGMAAGRKSIEELDVSILLPDDMYVVTRDTPKHSQVWTKLGVSHEDFLQYMTEIDMYLYAMSEDFSYEILVSGGWEAGLEEKADFDLYSVEELEEIYYEVYKSNDDYRLRLSQQPIYQAKSKTFLIYDLCLEYASVVDARMFCTADEGNVIVLTLSSLTGEIEAYQNSALVNIANSLDFESESVFTEKGNNGKSKSLEEYNDFVFTAIVLSIVSLLFILIYCLAKSEQNNRKEPEPEINQEKKSHQTTERNPFEENGPSYERKRPKGLIRCPECGGEISDKATVCVHCGYPLQKKKTKEDSAWPFLWWMWMSQNNDDMWMGQDNDE